MNEKHCYKNTRREIEHNACLVDFEQIRKFNDNSDEGKYNLVYICKDCGQDWTEEDILLFELPKLNSILREHYLFRKSIDYAERI